MRYFMGIAPGHSGGTAVIEEAGQPRPTRILKPELRRAIS